MTFLTILIYLLAFFLLSTAIGLFYVAYLLMTNQEGLLDLKLSDKPLGPTPRGGGTGKK